MQFRLCIDVMAQGLFFRQVAGSLMSVKTISGLTGIVSVTDVVVLELSVQSIFNECGQFSAIICQHGSSLCQMTRRYTTIPMQYGWINFLKYVDPIVKEVMWRKDDEKAIAESVLALLDN
jgi:hypothetical protein